jgi:hypothetical protein
MTVNYDGGGHMLIDSKFQDNGDLKLTVYSSSDDERQAVETILKRSGVAPTGVEDGTDSTGRAVTIYIVPATAVSTLSSQIGGAFKPNGEFAFALPSRESVD